MSTNDLNVKIATLSAQLASGALKLDQFNQEVAKLVAQATSEASARKLTMKVSEKGAVSVYGINARFPVSFYAEQWERLLSASDEIRAFIKANADKLPAKGEKKQAAAPAAPTTVALPAGVSADDLARFLAQAK